MKKLQLTFAHAAVAVLLVVSPLLAWTGVLETLAAADQGMAARSETYREAQRAMDRKDWPAAEQLFGQVAAAGGSDADAALYWQAFAQLKRGHRGIAVQTVAKLEETYPASTWIDDARALAAEARAGTAGALDLAAAEDEELELYALNSLMQVEAEKAVPILEKFLAGDHSLELKEKALFVLSQSGSPRAREVLVTIAKGTQHPELAKEAIEYLGLSGGEETAELLQQIYTSTPDREVKEEVLEAMMLGGHKDRVLAAAQNESDPELRSDAVELLGVMGATGELRRLYGSESSIEVKKDILEGMFVASDAETLAELARTEQNPELRLEIIEALGLVGSDSAKDTLRSLYGTEADRDVKEAILEAFFLASDVDTLLHLASSEKDAELRAAAIESLGLIDNAQAAEALSKLWTLESDPEIKEAILEAWFVQSNAKALIEIVRNEQDTEMRKQALEYLSVMGSDEAVDFLVGALEE